MYPLIKSSYPTLCNKFYQDVPNIIFILKVIQEEFNDIFDLGSLEDFYSTENAPTSMSKFFENCVQEVSSKKNEFFELKEITIKLAQFLYKQLPLIANQDLSVDKSSKQIGFAEKFKFNALQPESLDSYAFDTIDMVRTSLANAGKDTSPFGPKIYNPVVALDHIEYIPELQNLFLGKMKQGLFIRCRPKAPVKLPQWIVLYKNKEKFYVYSESPISEEDKVKLCIYLGTEPKYEGMTAALSVSSGMRAYTKWNEIKPTGGFSISADYPSLLVEWVWLTEKYSPRIPNFNWEHFRESMLQKKDPNHAFRLFDICSPPRHSQAYNDHMQTRSYILGLDWLLADEAVNLLKIDESQGLVTFALKEGQLTLDRELKINNRSLQTIFKDKYALKAFISFQENHLVKRNPNSRFSLEAAITGMVLNVFRACAKQKILNISIPSTVRLDEDEKNLIRMLMEQNPFVCRLVDNKHPDFVDLNQSLQHVFARNRWLSINEYIPPLIGHFWREAASYWVAHLKKNSSTLMMAHESQIQFRCCVEEMGVHGLGAVLKYLNEFQTYLKNDFDSLLNRLDSRPAFYAACPQTQMPEYSQQLLTHLQAGGYFPFTEFNLRFVSGANNEIIAIFDELNKKGSFQKLCLVDCLVSEDFEDFEEFKALLKAIKNKANTDEIWTCPIYIPELEQAASTPIVKELREIYLDINNALVIRARKKNIKALEERRPASLVKGVVKESVPDTVDMSSTVTRIDSDKFEEQLTNFSPIPFQREGGVALQMQQQQQIQQQRSQSFDLENEKGQIYEDYLSAQLVTYDNIDNLLSPYWLTLAREQAIDESKATLKLGNTSLQSFFYTWVNANPQVDAKHIIQKMTIDAARMLLKHHRQLSAGLNPYNLPKGFFTQRDAKGQLVLGYKPTLQYTTDSNPLTLKLMADIPKPEACLGNYRQFSEDSEWLKLFSQLQPQPADIEKAYAEFIRQADLTQLDEEQKNKIKANLHLFNTIYSLDGTDGVREFLSQPLLSDEKMLSMLFNELEEPLPKLASWLIPCSQSALAAGPSSEDREKYLKAMGQILFKYNRYGLTVFLTQLHNLYNTDHHFLDTFKEVYLSKCQTFVPLLEKDSLDTFVKMKDFFGQNREAVALWNQFLTLHMQAVDWDDFSQMWKGFNYFYQKINDLGLAQQLTPEMLHGIRPAGQNMFICFERILLALEKIPNADQQRQFLTNLNSIDLTEGGAPYAVRHEGFVIVEDDLMLLNFKKGTPTYQPNLTELFNLQFSKLSMHRALASQAHINALAYNKLKRELITDADPLTKHKLLFALHVRFESVDKLIDCVNAEENVDALNAIAKQFFKAFYQNKHLAARYPLDLLKKIMADFNQNHDEWNNIFEQYDNLWIFDCFQLLAKDEQLTEESLSRIKTLFTNTDVQDHPHLRQGLMLASMFQVNDVELQAFIEKTRNLKGNVRLELNFLTNQLLSLDLQSTELNQNWREIWVMIGNAIHDMNEHPDDCENIRLKLMTQLHEKGLIFKSSLAGEYQALTELDLEEVQDIRFFTEHQERLKLFFTKHLAKSQTISASVALKPIINFFKRLQLNKTYINEIEPLLNSLEKSVTDQTAPFWTTDFFNSLLKALEPKDGQGVFPFAILEAIISEKDSPFHPRSINHLISEFPQESAKDIQAILAKAGTFTRVQQTSLVKLTLRAKLQDQSLDDVIETLSAVEYKSLRGIILDFLLKSPAEQIIKQFEICQKLVSLTNTDETWSQTCQLWFEALNKNPEENTKLLKAFLNISPPISDERKALILRIVAWASISSSHLKSATTIQHLEKGTRRVSKGEKLLDRLQTLTDEELINLAKVYPSSLAPDAQQLLKFIKKTSSEKPLLAQVEEFRTDSSTVHKKDYAQVSLAREQDFLRMLKETRIIVGDKEFPLDFKDGLRLSMMFKYLKQLEDGCFLSNHERKPIKQMSPEELSRKWRELSAKMPQDDITTVQIWAILFEVMGRVTFKYPHLAQQFSLILNEIKLSELPSSILQLKTGEGKSHFVGLRAARLVGQNEKVDVCTAKWSLAERDLLDYKPFFDYLDIKTANIQSGTEDKTVYEKAEVVYTTPGDFSLFLDNHAYSGQAIDFSEKKPVCLGDEFDFLFYEGQKTQFNYAQHSGISPKEMNWFYRGLNDFYDSQVKSSQPLAKIDTKLLLNCHQFLIDLANTNDDKLSYLQSIEPRKLAAWLQSTHEAAIMKMGVHYTVRLEQVKIGDEELPLQEIYPLTKDMQAAVGSSFSHGVHQLLAERLNHQARKDGQAQNFHVHPESQIVSSQVFSQRLKDVWSKFEGFTGTVSATQAQELGQSYGTQVLRVPTNQKDLRKWPEPRFFADEKAQLKAIADKIKTALCEKKSILWCCETDSKVNEMQKKIRPYFTEEEWKNHFMVFTNESHQTAAEIFREKKEKEGLRLGQKERGVVLMAAAFGRGDNVDVEMLILQSVHDENDLGQKGGRTARNGEEGEVHQFYLTQEIETEYTEMLSRIQLEPYGKYKNSILEQIKNTYPQGQKSMSSTDKFNLILRLREFIQSVDNQASVYYHEAKAKMSTAVIKVLGKIEDPVERDNLAQRFSSTLEELDKEWTSLKTQYPKTEELIPKLKEHLINHVMQNVLADITIEFGDVKELKFLLKPQKQEEEDLAIQTAIQYRLLTIEDLPIDAEIWKEIQEEINKLTQEGRVLLDKGIRELKPLTVKELLAQCAKAKKGCGAIHGAAGNIKERNRYTCWENILHDSLDLRTKLHDTTAKLDKEAEKAVFEYLCAPGLSEMSEHVRTTLPLLQYVSSIPASEAEKAGSYFSEPSLVKRLVTLPPACFKLFATTPNRGQPTPPTLALNASTLLQIKNFLDQYLPDTDDATYAKIFRKIATGAVHQTEKRLRWFEQFIMMLDQADNKIALLETLSDLMQTFSNVQHFSFLDLLLNKTPALSKTLISQDRYHALLKIFNARPNLLKGLQPIDAMLRREGKAHFFHTENMLMILSDEVIVTYQDALTKLAQLPSTDRKKNEIENYSKIYRNLQQFAGTEHTSGIIGIMQGLSANEFILALDKFCSKDLFRNHNEQFFAFLISHSDVLAKAEAVESHLSCLERVFIQNPEINLHLYFDILLSYIQNKEINFDRFNELMALETLSDDHKVTVLWQNSEQMKKISALEESQYQALLTALNNDTNQLLMQHPVALEIYLDYLLSESFDEAQAATFANLLLDICKNADNKKRYFEHLRTTIQQKDKLKMTLELMAVHPQFMLEIGSNPLADYILANSEKKDAIKQSISTFYSQRTKENSDVPDLFDFGQNQEQRISWMKLLHLEMYVTNGQLNSSWTAEMNASYYALNLSEYNTFVDKAFVPNPGLESTRSLEVSKLHNIPQELAKIAGVEMPNGNRPIAIPQELKTELSTIIGQYRQAWFKNDERRRKVNELERLVNSTEHNSYLELIRDINVLKSSIQLEDTRNNIQSILRLFKPLHWFGRSRLQNALNTMQDTIIKAWLKDPLQGRLFNAGYNDAMEATINRKIAGLVMALGLWQQKNNALAQHLSIFKYLFISEKTEQAIRKVSQVLNSNNSPKDKLGLIQALGADIDQLPGDVKILVTEILSYSQDMPEWRVDLV